MNGEEGAGIQAHDASVFALRARNLRKGIQTLIGEKQASRLYGHPLVSTLASQKKLPSYIESRTFASALLDVLSHGEDPFAQDDDVPDWGAVGWIAHITGWLFTAAAVSLGAPFWSRSRQAATSISRITMPAASRVIQIRGRQRTFQSSVLGRGPRCAPPHTPNRTPRPPGRWAWGDVSVVGRSRSVHRILKPSRRAAPERRSSLLTRSSRSGSSSAAVSAAASCNASAARRG